MAAHETAPRSGDGPHGAPCARKGSGGFAGNVLALSGGAVAAQALTVASAPVVSRLFAPEAFGVAAVFASAVALLLGAGCLRYELAIPLPARDEDAAGLFALCCLVVLAVAGLVGVGVWLGGPAALRAIGAEELVPLRGGVPVAVFLMGMALPLRFWSTRQRQFRRLAAVRVASAVVAVGLTLGLGFAGFRSGGHLVAARVAGFAATFALLGWWCWRSDARFLARHVSLGGLRRLARRYAKFPLVSSWASFLNIASRNLPALMLVAFFGVATAGFYGRAWLLLMLPMELVGRSIGQVFFQRAAAERAAGGALGGLAERVSVRLVGVSVLPALVVALIGPELFVVVCGPRWAEAGVYARILSPVLLAVGVCSPMSTLTSVLERQGAGLAATGFLCGARVAALVVGGAVLGDARWTVGLFSIAGVVGYLGFYGYLLRAAGGSARRVGAATLRSLAYAVPTLAVGAAARWVLGCAAWQVVVCVAVASVSYWVLAVRDDAAARALVSRATGSVRAAWRMARSG